MHGSPSEVKRLDELARLRAWIDADDAITSLEKAGEGNMNHVFRARLKSGASIILKESLPYVAKYPDIPAPIERIQVEAAFYQAINETELTKYTPNIIGFDRHAHCLCLADLGDGADLSSLYTETHHPDPSVFTRLLAPLLDWLSKLHQLDIAQPEAFQNSAMRALNHTHIFVLPFAPDNGLEFSKALKAGRCELFDARLIEHALRLGEIYLDAHPEKGVLLHGDFYPGSWLQTDQGFAVIDPEFGFYGPAEWDVGVFIAHLYLAGFSQDQVDDLVAHYRQRIDLSLDLSLARQFAGIEILRRLFGVAQLPLAMNDAAKLEVAATAREMVTA